MGIMFQTAMSVVAAVTAVVPGVGATQRSEPERPVAAVAAAPSLKGKCARVGQTRTAKGVWYVCSKSKRWQVAPAGQIVAVGYIDIDGVMVGPESLGDERKCGRMSKHPEFTAWYRYANGTVRRETRKFLNHSGAVLDETRSGEPLPYLLYIDHSSLNRVGWNEELKEDIYETNLWVKCTVYKKHPTGPIDEAGLDS
jgi:hypothetical protein